VTAIPATGDGAELYHTGIVVPDLGVAAERYADLLGLQFASVRRSVMSVRVDGVVREAELLVTYTMTGPPYLELIEEVSGSVWGTTNLGLNHIGFYAHDLATARRRLEDAGLPARVHDNGTGGDPHRFTYHPMDGGMWVELVTTGFRAELDAWITRSRTAAP